jgi:hypothetical protein
MDKDNLWESSVFLVESWYSRKIFRNHEFKNYMFYLLERRCYTENYKNFRDFQKYIGIFKCLHEQFRFDNEKNNKLRQMF